MIAERWRVGDWIVETIGGPAWLVVDRQDDGFWIGRRNGIATIERLVENDTAFRPALHGEVPK